MHTLLFKKTFISLLLVFSSIPLIAQIQFQNPSFEQGGSPPTGWPFCNGTTDIEPGTFTNNPPSNGTRYLGFWDGGSATFPGITEPLGEGTMQKLVQAGQDCPLVIGKTYTFQVDVIANPNVNLTLILPPYDPGAIAFVAGFGQCSPTKLFWKSNAATTVPAVGRTWNRYSITFTADKAYSWVGFYALNRSGNEQVSIDNLSTITKIDGTVSSTNAGCNVGGTIKFNPASGSTGPFTFEWTKGGVTLPDTGDEIIDLTPGNYRLKVIDNSENCPVPSFFNVTISGTDPIIGSVSTSKTVLCEGESAQLDFTATDPSRTLNYKWTPAVELSNSNIKNPIASITQDRTYTLTVTDPNDPSCKLVIDTTLSHIEINAGLPSTVEACENEGTLDLFNEIKGTPDLGGNWTKPDGSPFNGTIDFASDIPGDYTYTVSHPTCPSESVAITVDIDKLVNAGDDGALTVCNTDQLIQLFPLIGGSPNSSGYWKAASTGGYDANNGTFNPNGNKAKTYDFTYTVDAAKTCPSDDAEVSITVEEVPVIAIEPIAPICEGNEAEIIYTTDAGKAPFTITIKENGTDRVFANKPNNGSIKLTPTKGSTYTLTTVESVSGEGCKLDTSITLIFDYYTAPTVSLDSAFCDATNTTYQVAMAFADGDKPTYELNGSINVNGQSNYVSDPMPSGTTFNFEIKDANGCLPVDNISGVFSCSCATKVGTLTYTGDTITICDGNTGSAAHNADEFLDGNDALSYVLHNSKGASLGTVLLQNATGTFEFDATKLSYNIVYYISAVAGDVDPATGLVDLSNPNGCMEVSPGQPVIFREKPSISFTDAVTDVCPSDNASWNISTVTGRLPLTVFDDAGNSYPFTGSPEILSQTIFSDTAIVLSSITDDYGCTANINPTLSLIGTVLDSIHFANYTFTCNANNTGYVAEFDIIGGDASSYQIINSNITGSLDAAGHYTSDELTNGFTFNLQATDGNSCNTPTLIESGLCPCATVSGEMQIPSTSSPIEFCIENTATVNFRDNNADGIADGYNPDGNDVQSFILLQTLSDTAIQPSPNFIAISSTPSFAYNAATMNTNTTYYIVPVAGDNDGNGLVDFNNGCRDFADGTPIRFNEPSTIAFTTPQEVCLGTDIPVSLNVTSTSQLTFTLVASNGYNQTFTYGPGNHTIDIPNTTSGNVVISIDTITNAFEDLTVPTACRARWISAPTTVGIVDLPTAAFAGKLNNTICDGETINADLLITGTGNFDVNLISGENFTATGTNNTYTNAFSFSPSDSTQYVLSNISVTSTLGLTCLGSIDATPFVVNVNSIDDANVGYSNGPICADNNSTLLVDVTGDNPAFSFYMTNASGAVQNEQTTGFSYTEARNNLQQTETYTLDSVFDNTISDATGKACAYYPNKTATLIVHALPTGAVALAGDDTLCLGESSSLNFEFTGTPDFITTIYDGKTSFIETFSALSNTLNVTPINASTYTIISITDGNNCTAKDISGTAFIDVKAIPTIIATPNITDSCVVLNVDFDHTTNSEFLGTCLWDFGDNTTSNTCSSISHSYTVAGQYSASLTVTSPENCTAQISLGDYFARPNPIAAMSISPEKLNVFNSEVILKNKSSIPTQAIWTIGDSVRIGNTIRYDLQNMPLETDISVKLFVETQYGCTDSTEGVFRIDDVTTVYVPSAFSPNGDGVNDVFAPVLTGILIDDYEFKIFNRWGQQIFSTDSPDDFWDGTYNNEKVKPDQYTWILSFRTPNGLVKARKHGKVFLLQ